MPLERFAAAWREQYVTSESAATNLRDDGACVFCQLGEQVVDESTGVLWKSSSSFVTLNAYPYGSGHLLVLPRRHVAMIHELSDVEYRDFSEALRMTAAAIETTYGADGMNIGLNLGRAGGAGIPKHLHAHVLPRWEGDTNFMTTIGETRILPESLGSTWHKVHATLENR